MENRPRAREKYVTEGGKGVHKRGSGTGMGPVGGSGGPSGGDGGQRGNGGGGKFGLIIALIVLLLGGGGTGVFSMMGSGNESYDETGANEQVSQYQQQDTVNTGNAGNTGNTWDQTGTSQSGASQSNGYSNAQSGSGTSGYSLMDILSGQLGGYMNDVGSVSTGWSGEPNVGNLNSSVSDEAREKYTNIKGNGDDVVTVMVYMCGTDLESRSGMATNDLAEMAKASLSDNVNVIVYTGGCKKWNNNIISRNVNQIYQIKSGGLKCLVSDDGDKVMTKPDTLTGFIRYCDQNFPADRNMLIFWDHGGGSISGYGYDEKNASEGSMTLSGIDSALKKAGITFDFIGFDACLMGTIETDLMAAKYADYLIGSEETEPGTGWYYTNWLTKLSQDTSMPTIEIGKNIIDDFVEVCARNTRGQKTTLSIVDLAELSSTVGDEFKAFSQGTADLIKEGEYKQVSDARSNVREFAVSSKVDQIDLVHFARNLGTKEGEALADTLLSAVKYNRTSSNISNAYGISVYFPYRKASNVSKAGKIYDEIGLDSEYSDCIREFASLEFSGQAATGGTSYGGGTAPSPLTVLLGESGGAGSGMQSLGQLTELISMFSGSSGASDIFTGRSLSDEETAEYVENNRFDASKLKWQTAEDGSKYMSLTEDQWSLVHSVDLNVFYDDGEGYVEMGLDNLYSFNENGDLVPDVDGTWLSINSQPVAYYHTDTIDDGENYTITGYVPAMLNGERVNLVIIFDNDQPRGYIAGADPNYDQQITETVARGLTELKDGDKIDFLCNYYTYDGGFDDSYYLGEQMTVDTSDILISNTDMGGDYIALYRFSDIYDQKYWSEKLEM